MVKLDEGALEGGLTTGCCCEAPVSGTAAAARPKTPARIE
jgi:hypothetical protein